MAMSQLQITTAEAACAALYRMTFSEFLGETEDENGWYGWFHLGESPKDMRVRVHRPHDREVVEILAEWRNYKADARNPLKGEQLFTLTTYAQRQEDMEAPLQTALTEVLHILDEVLREEGRAGMISDLIEETDQEVPE